MRAMVEAARQWWRGLRVRRQLTDLERMLLTRWLRMRVEFHLGFFIRPDEFRLIQGHWCIWRSGRGWRRLTDVLDATLTRRRERDRIRSPHVAAIVREVR